MRSALFLPILFLLFAGTVNATELKSDTASINHLLNIAYKELNPDTAIVLFDKVIQLSIKANYGQGAFMGMMTKGIKYFEKEDYVQYRNTTIKALPWAAKCVKKDAVAWCYANIGESYFDEGEYIKASEYYYTALREQKKAMGETPTNSAANIYNCLGLVNMRLNQPGRAIGYFNEAEGVSLKGKLYYQLANTYTYKGEYFNSLHQPDSAQKYFMEVGDIGRKIAKPDLEAIADNDLGKTYIEAGDYNKAVSSLLQAISIARDKFPYIAVDASYSLGDAWYHLHKYKDAETILVTALQEVIAHNFKDKYIKYYVKLIEVYKATGQYQKALDYTDIVNALKDSLISVEKAKAINQLDIKFQTAEKDKQIAQSQLQIATQNSNITRKNIWIAAVSGGIALLALLLLVIYRNARHKQRLQAEQIKTLQKENTIGNLKSMVQGEESERARIARELHDGIGGTLSAAMMRLMAVRHDKEDVTNVPAYNEALALLDDMGTELRKTAHNLMPETLLKQTLPEAVSAYCHSMQKDGTLHIDFQALGDFGLLGADVKLNVYRIVQELLRNIVQHAQATTALVQLMMHGRVLTVTVEDNGRGFDKDAMRTGMGMQNLQTRVSSMNGHYTLETAPGKGTTVFIEIDLTTQP